MRQHHFLAQQPQQVAVGLQQRRTAAAEQQRLELAYIPREQRRERQHDHELSELDQRVEDYCHTLSTINSATSAPNTRVR